MSLTFPDTPAFSGFAAPFRSEIDIQDLVVEGEIPQDLNGHFYRVQPDFIYPPRYANDVPFNGDGNVTLFRFDQGHVDVKTRYVQTQRYKAQSRARKALFGTYRNPRTDDPSVEGLSAGTANTNLVFHHGKLFALKEDSPPVELDPTTLETLDDYYTFGGDLSAKTFTAHPKIDPVSGDMFAIAYEAKGEASRDIAFYAITPEGKIRWEAWIEAPYACMIHDFALTQTHIAVLLVPMIVDVAAMEKDGVHFSWDSSLPTWLGVIEREGDGSDVRWFKGPEKCATHVMNAFSEGSQLHIDMDMADGNQFPFFPSLHEPWDMKRASGKLSRISVDLDKDDEHYQITELFPQLGVLPRVDERYWSLPYHVGFMPVMDPTQPKSEHMRSAIGFTINNWVRFDHNSGTTSAYFPGPSYTLQECQFVAKSADAREGEGYLIGVANNYETMLSELHILDAENLEGGPLAMVKLPVRLRNGVHGHWVGAERL